MALLVPDVGEVVLLATIISVPMRLRLYSNDYTPVEGSVLGDFTNADYSGGGGYQTITWGTPGTSSGVTFVIGQPLLFQHSGGATANTIYGYYITKNDDTTLVYAERFASSKSMAALTDYCIPTPRLELG